MTLPSAWKSEGVFDDEGMLVEGTMGAKTAGRMLDQLIWHARSMRAAREAGGAAGE